MNENSPVLDLEPLVEPPAEEQRLEGDFLHGHPLKVDVDPGTFFTQEFWRKTGEEKHERGNKQTQENPFSQKEWQKEWQIKT